MLIRDLVTPLRLSVTGWPDACSAVSDEDTVVHGRSCLSAANAPATCGAAIEVPVQPHSTWLIGTELQMSVPGREQRDEAAGVRARVDRVVAQQVERRVADAHDVR